MVTEDGSRTAMDIVVLHNRLCVKYALNRSLFVIAAGAVNVMTSFGM